MILDALENWRTYSALPAWKLAFTHLLTLTPETERMFDAGFFAAARQGAYFINVGRGKSVVQDDLVAALKSGHLAGAGLDVTEPEPLLSVVDKARGY